MNKPTDGPSSNEHASGKDELGFDPDSPDVADPQVDPIGPAIAPLDKKDDETAKKAALRSVGRLEAMNRAPPLCGALFTWAATS